MSQVNSGFEETREFARQIAKEQGIKFSSAMQARLNQTRAFATFTYPNSYAAHLILTIPLVLVCIWNWSKHIHPPRGSQYTFTGMAAILSVSALYFTGSRGAVVAVALSVGTVIGVNFSQVYRWARSNQNKFAILTGGIILLVLVVSISGSRSLASMSSRFHYYAAAVKMFSLKPIFGVGLGEFFTWYLRLKPMGAEETRLVHNFFLHFLSQCGVFGGVAAAYFLVQPVILRYLIRINYLRSELPALLNAMLLGCLAWNFHSLADFNVQIPGTMMIASTLPLLVITPRNCTPMIPSTRSSKLISMALIFVAGIGIGSLWRLPGEKSYQILYDRFLAQKNANLPVDQVKLSAKLLPYSSYPYSLLGKNALAQQDYGLSQYAFREAIKRAPHRAGFYAMLAQSLIAEGKVQEADRCISKALEWYPLKSEFKVIKDFTSSHLQ